MLIKSLDLPQADRISSVVAATVAVANGAKTDIEIADAVPGIEGDARQGRYYRRAAESLGFVTNTQNNAAITMLGQRIAAQPSLSNKDLIAAVLGLNLYQRLVPFLALHPQGVSRTQIENFLKSISDPNMGTTMIPRRISTIITWLRNLGILTEKKKNLVLDKKSLKSYPILQIKDIEQPVLPKTGSMTEYKIVQTRKEEAKDLISYYVDQAKTERANSSHQQLVNLVAERINQAGARPTSNAIIDLAANLSGNFIFEMKSTTDKNARTQVRKGVSQLYEYRYLENSKAAKLVLVIEKPLAATDQWMTHYLESDREILLVWDGNGHLYGSDRARAALPFLKLER